MRHIDVERSKRGITRKDLLLRAMTAYIGDPPDYEAELDLATA